MDGNQLALWAKELITVLATVRTQSGLTKLSPIFQSWAGNFKGQFHQARGWKSCQIQPPLLQCKRPAQWILDGPLRKSRPVAHIEENTLSDQDHHSVHHEEGNAIVSLPADNTTELAPGAEIFETVETTPILSTPLRFHQGDARGRQSSHNRRWSWKREARTKGRLHRTSFSDSPVDGEGCSRTSNGRQDFQEAEEAGQIKPLPYP